MDKTYLLDTSWLTPVVGLFIPILVGLLAKSTASSQLKALLNFGLSAVAGAVTTVLANSGALKPREFISGIVLTWLASWASYAGLLKPAGVTDAVQSATRSFGVSDGKVSPNEAVGGNGEIEQRLLALHQSVVAK